MGAQSRDVSKAGKNIFARNKYGAVRTTLDGITFDSKAEATRYAELKLLFLAGEIESLERQVPYKLIALGGEDVGTYVADFAYLEKGNIAVEDVKGHQTALSKWKIRHFEAQYGIKIRIIRER